MEGIVSIVVRSVIVYLFIVIALRVFGKKELSQLSVIDLVFILLISNAVQNAMVGEDTSLIGGLVAAGSLFVVSIVLDKLAIRSKTINKLLEGEPIMLVYDGHVLTKHLLKANISHEELEAAIREHGVKDIKAVNLAVLEADGNISVLSENYHQHSRKKRKGRRGLEDSSS